LPLLERALRRLPEVMVIADFLKDGPRGWAAVTLHGKAAGHKPGTLERVRAIVAETFKRKGQEGRWLWRLIGDDRTSSEGDIADFFGAGEIGLPNFDGPGLEPLPPLPAGAYDNDEDQDEEDFDDDNAEEDDEETDAAAGEDEIEDDAGDKNPDYSPRRRRGRREN
jgi:hypothetical protein